VSEARLKSKFALLAGCALPGDRVQSVLEMVNELERLDDSRRLSQLLAVPT